MWFVAPMTPALDVAHTDDPTTMLAATSAERSRNCLRLRFNPSLGVGRSIWSIGVLTICASMEGRSAVAPAKRPGSAKDCVCRSGGMDGPLLRPSSTTPMHDPRARCLRLHGCDKADVAQRCLGESRRKYARAARVLLAQTVGMVAKNDEHGGKKSARHAAVHAARITACAPCLPLRGMVKPDSRRCR